LWIKVKNQPNTRNVWIRGVITRSGKEVAPNFVDDASKRGTEGVESPGGTNTTVDTHSQGPRDSKSKGKKGKERVTFWDGVDPAGNLVTDPKLPSMELPKGGTYTGEGAAAPTPSATPKETKSVWERDWAVAYSECPFWKEIWLATQKKDEWPKGVKVHKDRMFFEERLCVPFSFQEFIVQEIHEFLGHVGPEKVWNFMTLRYAWADSKGARIFNESCSKNCLTCQASSRGETLKGPIDSTPIPPAPMISVALDIFKMPLVMYEGENYNTMAVCVDRHSGWIVATPFFEKGLTGAKLAKAMIKNQWRPFGVPSIISSDQGSHFVNTWWQTMCSLMGIRQAFSQAYHHQANGRVERAGQQVMEILRKLFVGEKINWVEALPQTLDRIHDVKGESGLSPYEILFGRERPLGGVPYEPPKECEDAQQFFKRMKEIDEKVAMVLNHTHEVQARRINQGRRGVGPGQPDTYPPTGGGGPARVLRAGGPMGTRNQPGAVVPPSRPLSRAVSASPWPRTRARGVSGEIRGWVVV
jgi:hypothetical protein